MPKKYRLTGEDMRGLSGPSVPASRKRVHGKFFSLLIAPIAGTHPKCAIVVSRKVSLRAVDRNRVKRRARSLIANHIGDLDRAAALVFYAKREAKGAEFSEISEDIAALFSKL